MTMAPPRRRKRPATTFSNSTPSEDSPALLSIFGGKITTYRRLAEAALAILSRRLPPARKAAGWTGQDALPGGDFPTDGFETLVSRNGDALSFSHAGHGAPSRPRLRHTGGKATGRGEDAIGSRSDVRRRPDRSRGPLSREKRMGDERRRRRLAALQAGIADVRGRGPGSRRLSRNVAGSATNS